MRRVLAMGETIMDILFREGQPVAAVPGGSSFNSIISLGRAGLPAVFIGDTGEDEVGRRIAGFARENHVDAGYLNMRSDMQSALSLAFLDEQNDARYLFYKQPPQPSPCFAVPEITDDDILQFGSYYAIAPAMRQQVSALLEYARQQNAILFYDLNFRRSHRAELDSLLPAIHANFRLSDVVRGSADDFEIMYDERDPETVYRRHIAPHCPLFICTQGAEGIVLCTPEGTRRFAAEAVQTVSTVGAGDNFNAGFIYGLMRCGVRRDALHRLPPEKWEELIDCGRKFAANVCASVNNSIDKAFGEKMKSRLPEEVFSARTRCRTAPPAPATNGPETGSAPAAC